ncbi:hypothetical protein B296_00013674 [Ensete ventricosum]|uniref:PB1 domain-containing protein n=1 Tax=Ensete ventricosum TaxID=4639 RepID=A0A427B895_ENSVE|nr:hypothetical protein B296_00013674 [Ensete ventricosum]
MDNEIDAELTVVIADDESSEMEKFFKRAMPWLGEEICIKDSQTQSTIMPGLSLVQWMNLQQNPSLANQTLLAENLHSLNGAVMQNLGTTDLCRQYGLHPQMLQHNNIQFNTNRYPLQAQEVDEIVKKSVGTDSTTATSTHAHIHEAVGRSIDVTHYSGYDELKHDLARMFSIEGQLEDRQRIGWKLVYVDHENDVLLVGDDPWE